MQASCERLHRVLQARATQHEVLLAVAPVTLLVHDFVQPDVAHVAAVVVGKDGVGEVEHARAEATARKVLQQRLLGHGRALELSELLEALMHERHIIELIRLRRRQQRAFFAKVVIVRPVELDEVGVRPANDSITDQVEQPVVGLTVDKLGTELKGPPCERRIVQHTAADLFGCLEYNDTQASRVQIAGGRQTRRAAADDDDVHLELRHLFRVSSTWSHAPSRATILEGWIKSWNLNSSRHTHADDRPGLARGYRLRLRRYRLHCRRHTHRCALDNREGAARHGDGCGHIRRDPRRGGGA